MSVSIGGPWRKECENHGDFHAEGDSMSRCLPGVSQNLTQKEGNITSWKEKDHLYLLSRIHALDSVVSTKLTHNIQIKKLLIKADVTYM